MHFKRANIIDAKAHMGKGLTHIQTVMELSHVSIYQLVVHLIMWTTSVVTLDGGLVYIYPSYN